MSIRASGSPIYQKIYLGATGIAQGSVTFEFEVDGVSDSPTVNWAEDAIGWYEFDFSPSIDGDWTLSVKYGSFLLYFSWNVSTTAIGDYAVNDTAYFLIYVGDTGLAERDFTFELENDNAATAQVMTITEQSAGFYDVSYPMDAIGDWHGRVSYGSAHFLCSAFCESIATGGTTIQFGSTSSPVVVLNQATYKVVKSQQIYNVTLDPI